MGEAKVAPNVISFSARISACEKEQEKLEQAIAMCEKRRAIIGLMVLSSLSAIIGGPLGFWFEDSRLQWVLLKKDVPPNDAGGVWLMLLYAANMVATLAAIMLFVTPTRTALDKVIEAAGTRSLMVYMVHLVFIMVPGEWLCLAGHTSTEHSGLFVMASLFILAFAVNLLCGSDFTACVFQPLLEPLATIRGVSTKVSKATTKAVD